ncbi:alpha/beta hydrolase [Haloglycomyces albus]|uniref:alpha/beta hydrolase n=1 Tax=Haloglycomyces albus TaxID=526067 RepID=UPI00046D505D|nr:alpha/beta hydrolase [Haloglycomyces albus]
MSDLDWKTLQDTDFSYLGDFAAYLKKHIGDCEEVEDKVFKDNDVFGVEDSEDFTGDVADETRYYLTRTVSRYLDDLEIPERIMKIVLDAEEEFTSKQTDLEKILEEAGPGLSPAGTVGNEKFVVNGRAGGSDVTFYQDVEIADHCDTMSQRFKELMNEAREYDSDLKERLNAVDDSVIDLPPSLASAEYDQGMYEYAEAEYERLQKAVDSGDAQASDMTDWWNSLDKSDQQQMLQENYESIGRTDGIPTDARDDANRLRLENALDLSYSDHPDLDTEIQDLQDRLSELRQEQSGYGGGIIGDHPFLHSEEYRETRDKLDGLLQERDDRDRMENLQDRITSESPSGQDYYLMDYDIGGDGKVALSVGNPDTADNTAVYVPGTAADFSGSHGGLMDRSEQMALDAQERSPGEETASVMWLGYDAPDHVGAAVTTAAEEGAEDFSNFMEGMDSTGDSNTTAIGHSYGTRLIGESASEYGIATDQIISVASPGMGVDSAGGLGIDSSDFYAVKDDNDIIGVVPDWDVAHGPDPTNDDFGGNVFESDAGDKGKIATHSAYWDSNNPSRESMADIITGDYSE